MSYLIFLIVAPPVLALTIWGVVITWKRRSAPGAKALLLATSCGAMWLAVALWNQSAPTVGLPSLGAQGIFLATPWTAIGWLAFALIFSGRAQWLRKPPFLLVCLIGVITNVLAITMPWHGLIRTTTVVLVGESWVASALYGPWFWVHIVMCWVAVITGSSFILVEYVRSLHTYRRLSIWLAVGSVIPIVFNALWVFRLLPSNRDFSSVGVGLGIVVVIFSVFRHRFLDLQPVARSVLIDSMTEGLIVLDAQGRVTDFNTALGNLTGLSPQLGMPLTSLASALQPALTAFEGEVTIMRADGPRHVEWRAADIGAPPDRQGRLLLLHDVTERRRAEMTLRETMEALKARNEELDAYGHMVAHDLKNPIQAIRGYAELLRDEGQAIPPDLYAESVEVILHTTDKMNTIVQDLLLLAGVRRQTVTPVSLDMAAIVQEARLRLRPLFLERDAVVEAPTTWPLALGYAQWIEEVWVNYLSNAVKYGGHPPRIILGSDVGAGPDGSQVRFWVRDNGAGLAANLQAEVFTPFTRFHEEQAQGHGLGLAIVSRVLERLGGSYGVEQPPGGGCLFYFTLPAAAGSTSAVSLAHNSADHEPSSP